jgi:acyl dehydratase
MTMDLDRIGARSEPMRRTWQARDCALYALALGAGWDELEYLGGAASGATQKVFPSFVLAGIMAAESASWPDPGFATGDYAPHEIVHGEQALAIHAPIGPCGDAQTTTRVAGIYDKGSGALVVLEVEARDTASGAAIFTATTSLFVKGHGGFGGERGPKGARVELPERPPDHCIETPTLPIQTLLYRHAGYDANPIHVDPAVAQKAGFRGPILMGLNTLGIACRSLIHAVGESKPESLRGLSGRFANPGYNGDVLTTEIWQEPERVLYRVVNQQGSLLLDAGSASFAV